jgi:hypothetical protein
MQGGTLCAVHANHGVATIDLPVSQGSIRIEYAPFPDLKSDAEGCTSGENMRRKLASAFKCLTVNDIADHKVSPSRTTPRSEDERVHSDPDQWFHSSASSWAAMWSHSLDALKR